MNVPKGLRALIYKELLLRMKIFAIGFATWFAFLFLTVSVCLSRLYGNLRVSESFNDSIVFIMTYAAALVLMVIVSDGGDSIYNDAKCNWDRYEYTTPVTAGTSALARIILIAASTFAGFVISVFSTWLILALSGKSFGLADFSNLTLILAVTVFMAVLSTWLKLKYKDPSKVSARIVIIIAVPYAALMIWGMVKLITFMDKNKMSDEEAQDLIFSTVYDKYAAVRDAVFPFTLLILAALIVGGYFMFRGQIRRREN